MTTYRYLLVTVALLAGGTGAAHGDWAGADRLLRDAFAAGTPQARAQGLAQVGPALLDGLPAGLRSERLPEALERRLALHRILQELAAAPPGDQGRTLGPRIRAYREAAALAEDRLGDAKALAELRESLWRGLTETAVPAAGGGLHLAKAFFKHQGQLQVLALSADPATRTFSRQVVEGEALASPLERSGGLSYGLEGERLPLVLRVRGAGLGAWVEAQRDWLTLVRGDLRLLLVETGSERQSEVLRALPPAWLDDAARPLVFVGQGAPGVELVASATGHSLVRWPLEQMTENRAWVHQALRAWYGPEGNEDVAAQLDL